MLNYHTGTVRADLTPPGYAVVSLPQPSEARLSVERVSVRYPGVVALDEISLAVADREMLCLLGPSGSGKSTLLRVVAGIETPTSGRVLCDGVEVVGPDRFVEPEHRRVGMVFQDYALFPHLTVAANVAFGLAGRSKAETVGIVNGLLERLGLTRYAQSYPHTLSGGERQRVALARAMAPAPRILLMDEPFSSLDGRLRDEVRRQAMAFLRDAGITTIVVTHDPDEAMRIGDRIALLRDGRLMQCARPDELYAHPATTFAARMFGDLNELRGMVLGERVDTALGSFAVPHMADRVEVSVCIRPEHVHLSAHRHGVSARVVSVTFLGGVDQVAVAVAGHETPIVLRTTGRAEVNPGQAVHVEVHPADAMIMARDTH